jgi:hypothetical protein
MLAPEDRPPPSIAQTVIGAVLRRVFLQYARYGAAFAVSRCLLRRCSSSWCSADPGQSGTVSDLAECRQHDREIHKC